MGVGGGVAKKNFNETVFLILLLVLEALMNLWATFVQFLVYSTPKEVSVLRTEIGL